MNIQATCLQLKYLIQNKLKLWNIHGALLKMARAINQSRAMWQTNFLTERGRKRKKKKKEEPLHGGDCV